MSDSLEETDHLGSEIGHYQVTALIGEGGMGRVYRATDTVLNRQVAIKVLRGADPGQLVRFKREAQVLASLNHPGIASIYGIEDVGGAQALVMELVDGDTLATVMANQGSRSLPIAESTRIILEIADALEAAHSQGIIHRDLKPSNIKLTHDGHVKVLDFGLAKTIDYGQLGESVATSELTRQGVILGTAAYMSPEQARGDATDRRTDVWALGAVWFELLAGEAPFRAQTPVELIASVLKTDPDFGRLPQNVPFGVRATVMRCLEKGLDRRLRDIGDVRLLLTEVERAVTEVAATRPEPTQSPKRWVAGLAGGLAIVSMLFVVWLFSRPGPTPVPRTPVRLQLSLADRELTGTTRQMLSISPDGSRIAFVAGNELRIRVLADLTDVAVRGSEGAETPFFSPDGRSIGYWAAGRFLKVPVDGGTPQIVASAPRPWGASWAVMDTIVFGQGPDGVWTVPASGGTPEQIVSPESFGAQRFAYGPTLLPSGDVLFTLSSPGRRLWDDGTIVIAAPGASAKTVIEGGTAGQVLATGHLAFAHAGTIQVVDFDAGTGEVSGVPVVVVEGIRQAPPLTQGAAHFAVSAHGTLVYMPGTGGVIESARSLALVDLDGTVTPLPLAPRPYYMPRVSPDGSRVALDISDESRDIWIYDFGRRALNRLTFDSSAESYPVWTPSGDSLVMGASPGGGVRDLFVQVADGSAPPRRLTETRDVQLPHAISPDGLLVYTTVTLPDGASDLALLSIDGDGTPRRLTQTAFAERAPALSPDGAWLAYASNESGRFEVYVTQFPSLEGRWQVSSEGGSWPAWSPTRNELYFIGQRTRMMAVPFATSPTVRFDPPRQLFEGDFHRGAGRTYDVMPDGESFLMVYRDANARRDELHVVVDWFAELTERVPR